MGWVIIFFDAIETFIGEGRKNSDDHYFFFDNDILFNKSLSECIGKLKEFQYLAYNINHEYSRDSEKLGDFNGVNINELPKEFDFFGGDFLVLKVAK